MSIVAEFVGALHAQEPACAARSLTPVPCRARVEKLHDVKAVIFDVYGTMVDYWRPEFADPRMKEDSLLHAFRMTAEYFGLSAYLEKINPGTPPERTLHDFYHGLIALNHEKSLKKGVTFPEVKIEDVWNVIIMMVGRHGWDPAQCRLGDQRELSRCMAYYYNFHALGRRLYQDVVPCLETLLKNNIHCGILSNAQFYTPMDLTLLIRDESGDRIDDYLDLFCRDLIIYSFEYGVAKPNRLLFERLYDGLYELHILPRQTVFVGNDLSLDIKPAQEAGMKTAFFTGDDTSAYMHDLGGTIVPDLVFETWEELPGKLSFFEKKS